MRHSVIIPFVILFITGCVKPPGLSQTKIMALGESTTAAAPGYRKKFLDLANSDNLIIDMIGPNSDGTQFFFDGDHAGFRGKTCSDLLEWIGSGEVKYSPDIVILWEGTNDCGWGYQFYTQDHQIIDELSFLIDKICAEYPDALVFVGSVPPMTDTAYGEYNTPTGIANGNVIALNNAMPEMIKSKVREGKKVQFVDARSLISVSTDISSDGIHPNQIGYEKMGALFYNAVYSYLY
jgi:lysophospholipase L1-like esterase